MRNQVLHLISPFRPILGALSFFYICLMTLILAGVLHIFALYFYCTNKQKDPASNEIYQQLYETWFACIYAWFVHVLHIDWELDKEQDVQLDSWHLVIANHQSWVDIFVVFAQIKDHMPLPKVFMKQSLIWIPLIGSATYLMGFPFMRRYSKAFLSKHPHLKGKDIETTRRSCRRFMQAPNTVLSFVEGTRWSSKKHAMQGKLYQNLLKPRAGGVAFVLQAMPNKFKAVVDMSVIYPQKNISFWDLLCGRVTSVKVIVRTIPFPAKMLQATDFQPAGKDRAEFNEIFNQYWDEKDQRISHYKKAFKQTEAVPKQGVMKSG